MMYPVRLAQPFQPAPPLNPVECEFLLVSEGRWQQNPSRLKGGNTSVCSLG